MYLFCEISLEILIYSCVGQGTLNQGELLGGGMQCTCIATAFLCLSSCDHCDEMNRNVYNSSEIDKILQEGTDIYMSLIDEHFNGKPRYLLISELPRSLKLRGLQYEVVQLEAYTGLIGTKFTDQDSLTFTVSDAVVHSLCKTPYCFLTIGNKTPSFTSAIRKFDETCFWVFDSHSRNAQGFFCINGKAVLMEFNSIQQLIQYIINLANSLDPNPDGMSFEFVPVDCREIKQTMPLEQNKYVDEKLVTEKRKIDNCDDDSTFPPLASDQASCKASYNKKWLTETGRIDGRTKYRCEPCYKLRETIGKNWSYRGKLHGLCSEKGVVLRNKELDKHFLSDVHTESVKAWNIAQLSSVEKSTATHIRMYISKENEAKANKIGGYMIEIYNNAKRGTMSAFSWPSTHLSHRMGNQFHMQSPHTDFNPPDSDFSYLTPTQHCDLMRYIVNSHKPILQDKIKQSRAVCLSVDGSVDRFQVDNKHVKCKIITASGCEQDIFLGFDQAKERKTAGYVGAVKAAVKWCIPWSDIFSKTISIVTDGENANTGIRNSLWASLEAERKTEDGNLPLLKIWCGVHRSDLAFTNVSKTIPEVHNVISDAVSLTTFFHTSGARTKELQETATLHKFSLRRLPKYFEVRWTEFSYKLITSILFSWRAITTYLKTITQTDSAANGHLANLTDFDKIRTACLVADILMIYSRFQKSIQDNQLNIFGLKDKVETLKKSIVQLNVNPLVGGWEELFQKNVKEDKTLHGVKLNIKARRRQSHHSLVQDKRDFDAIRNETIASLLNFVEDRFQADNDLHASLQPLLKLNGDVTDSELRACHSSIIPDMDLASFALQYRDAASSSDLKSMTTTALLKHIVSSRLEMEELVTALARVSVTKPHSADVERLIRSYSLIKTIDRASLSAETLKCYLYIRHNMPVLAKFDPRPAVLLWLTDKDRRDVVPQKAKEQKWFKSVFEEAEEQAAKKQKTQSDKIQF